MDLGIVGEETEGCDMVEMAQENQLYEGGAAGDTDAEGEDAMTFEDEEDEEDEIMMGQDDGGDQVMAEGLEVNASVLEDLLGLMKVCLHLPYIMTSYIRRS